MVNPTNDHFYHLEIMTALFCFAFTGALLIAFGLVIAFS